MEEVPSRIEPCLLDGIPPALHATVDRLRRLAKELPACVDVETRADLSAVVTIANAYWSAVIEKKPFDVFDIHGEATGDLAEGFAHVAAQGALDALVADGRPPVSLVSEVHRHLYGGMADGPRFVGDQEILPGAFRSDHALRVVVGRHWPPSSESVASFMAHWEKRYGTAAGRNILAVPAAHHRLSFIHPFVDGNGRTARLITHAMCAAAGIGADGLWSVSRALGRDGDGTAYLAMMESADMPRQGALDGRGNLSLKALERFTGWMLSRFEAEMEEMSGLLAPANGLQRQPSALLAALVWR